VIVAQISASSGECGFHEIKHDGFRILARKDGGQIKLITNGYDFADSGFGLLRYREHDHAATLCA
jgi:ATP-dependent DNA ligase